MGSLAYIIIIFIKAKPVCRPNLNNFKQKIKILVKLVRNDQIVQENL